MTDQHDNLLTAGEPATYATMVVEMRGAAERDLPTLERQSSPDGILDAITAALPVPAVLLRGGGHVAWMNREAQLRLGAIACRCGSGAVCTASSPSLEELFSYVCRELCRSTGGAKVPAPPSLECLLPGESIVLRAIERRGLARCVLVCFCPPAPPRAGAVKPKQELGLSARESEIALRAVEGYSVLGIATQLGIAESTVCTHLKRIYRKLGVCSRAELAWRIVREQRASATAAP